VSWNGATEVHAWQLEAGTSAGTLQPIEPVLKTGFETKIRRPYGLRVFAVTALDRSGKALGRSKVVRV
jgi:hypothetical protein